MLTNGGWLIWSPNFVKALMAASVSPRIITTPFGNDYNKPESNSKSRQAHYVQQKVPPPHLHSHPTTNSIARNQACAAPNQTKPNQ